jgi:hypothetical protein
VIKDTQFRAQEYDVVGGAEAGVGAGEASGNFVKHLEMRIFSRRFPSCQPLLDPNSNQVFFISFLGAVKMQNAKLTR